MTAEPIPQLEPEASTQRSAASSDLQEELRRAALRRYAAAKLEYRSNFLDPEALQKFIDAVRADFDAADPINLDLAFTTAEAANNTRDYKEALNCLSLADAVDKSNTVPDNLVFLDLVKQRADALNGLRRTEEAVVAYEEVISGYRARGAEGHAGLLSALQEIGVAYRGTKQFEESEAAFKEALSLASQLDADARKSASIRHELSLTLKREKKHEEAAAQLQLALSDLEGGIDDPRHPFALLERSKYLHALSWYQSDAEAEQTLLEVISLRKKVFPDRKGGTFIGPLVDLANIMFRKKDFVAAENLVDQAIDQVQKPDTFIAMDLSRAYEMKGRMSLGRLSGFEAEKWLSRAQQLRAGAMDVGLDSLRSDELLFLLAKAKLQAGKRREGAEIYRQIISVADQRLTAQEVSVSNAVIARWNLAALVESDEEKRQLLYRALEIEKEYNATDDGFSLLLELDLALIGLNAGNRGEAEAFVTKRLEDVDWSNSVQVTLITGSIINLSAVMTTADIRNIADKIASADYWDNSNGTVTRDLTLSYLYLRTLDYEKAYGYAQHALEIADQATPPEQQDNFDTAQRSDEVSFRTGLLAMASILSANAGAELGHYDGDGKAELFELLQHASLSVSANSFLRKQSELTAQDESQQEAISNWREAQERLHELDQQMLLTGREDRLPLLGEREEVLKVVESAESQLRDVAPAFHDLVKADPISLSELQSGLLRPDEALILIGPDNDQEKGAAFNGFVFVTTADGAAWDRLQFDPGELSHLISELHDQLENGGKTRDPLQRDAEILTYDRALAYNLYQKLFGGAVAQLLSEKEKWTIVPQGTLMSLPFAALVTEAPSGDDISPDALRGTHWLGIEKTIALAPSVATVSLQRRLAQEQADNTDRIPFLGIGDPAFSGAPEPEEPCMLEDRRGPDAPGSAEQYFEGGVGYTDRIASLARLPCTAPEVRKLAGLFGEDSRVLLQMDASEGALNRMDAAGDLNRTDVIAFATHGLVSGDFSGTLAEPALVLTPVSSEADDDGLLTASEIAQLSLSADWVILSACNTAVGGRPDSESLSGLARGFFYAGAKSLLVSHFPVYDDAASRLTTGAVMWSRDSGAEDNRGACSKIVPVDRASSLRKSMCELMNEPGNDAKGRSFAHPSAWASFSIIDAR